jgi:hypothetical protein
MQFSKKSPQPTPQTFGAQRGAISKTPYSIVSGYFDFLYPNPLHVLHQPRCRATAKRLSAIATQEACTSALSHAGSMQSGAAGAVIQAFENS